MKNARKRDAKVFYHGEHEFLMFPGRMGHMITRGKKIQSQVRVQEVSQLSRYIYDDHDHHGPGKTKNDNMQKSQVR